VDSKTSDTPWLAPVAPDLVWFGGSDATRFLNDLISQEIGDMVEGEARRSFLLVPQGKLDFLLWVIKEDGRYGLVTDAGRGAELATRLGRYRIRVDVTIEPATEGVWIVIGGEDGYDVSWPDVPRRLVLGERPALPVGTLEDYESLRISAGEPSWGLDVDEGTIPHESGLVPVSVDFTKGCYLGQELVARIDSRGGNVPRHLRLVDAGDATLVAGSPLQVEGKEVGTVTSAAGSVGLAMVRREIEPDAVVEVGDAVAVVKAIPVGTPR
jgi:folate-binding protein YgfZ